MKRSDLGIVILHWLMAISLIGVSVTGLLYKFKAFQPYFAWLFVPANMGAIHIWLSVMVIYFLMLYIIYIKKSNFIDRLKIHWKIRINGQIRWKYLANISYWFLLSIVILETISGVLLTKLINWDTLFQIFYMPKNVLVFLHLHLVFFILAFPVFHVIIHWMDGGRRKLASMFRPQIFPSRPSMIDIMVKMKEENTELKKKVKSYELASRSTNSSRS